MMIDVTDSEVDAADAEADSRARGRDAPPRRGGSADRLLARVPLPLSALTRRGHWRAVAGRAKACRPLSARLPSVAQVWDRTWRGDWVPGQRHWSVEAAGVAYGLVLAMPLVVAAYVLAWLAQPDHPGRPALAGLVVLLVWLTL